MKGCANLLIDNLHRINSPADLFAYICEIESSTEELNQKYDLRVAQVKRLKHIIKDFLDKYRWDTAENTPMPNYDVEVHLIDESDGKIKTVFTEATFNKQTGWQLPECYAGWSVLQWRYIPESDLLKSVSVDNG